MIWFGVYCGVIGCLPRIACIFPRYVRVVHHVKEGSSVAPCERIAVSSVSIADASVADIPVNMSTLARCVNATSERLLRLPLHPCGIVRRLSSTIMLYRCHVLVPVQVNPRIVTIEGDSPEYAANEVHSLYFTNTTDSLHVLHSAKDGSGLEDVYFAIIDVNGERYTSRMFKQQIRRKGGIKPRNAPTLEQRLATIAKALDWDEDPMELVGSACWVNEEIYP